MTSMLLAEAAPVRPLGRLTGIKPAAMPVAMFVAGSAVPVLSRTVGWRWASAGGVLLTDPGLWAAWQVLAPDVDR